MVNERQHACLLALYSLMTDKKILAQEGSSARVILDELYKEGYTLKEVEAALDLMDNPQ